MLSADDRENILIALINAVPGREDELNAWYTGTHIPEILELPGFQSAQRYELAGDASPMTPFRYATIYRVEGSAAEARDRLFSAGIEGSSDIESTIFAPFVPMGSPFTSGADAVSADHPQEHLDTP